MRPIKTRNQAPRDYASDANRWMAVLRRDTGADGKFFYSVKTTGVFCRPSCRARRPKRENVRFHNSSADARKAGFRPCKRCQPEGPGLEQQYASKIAQACRTIETGQNSTHLAALARAVGMSRFHFHRIFTRLVGVTPKAYALAHRAKRVRQELGKGRTVTDAIYEAGFNSNGRFYAESSRILGMKPKTFGKGGAGETIRFAVGPCSLGLVLVAASDTGICAVFLGDEAKGLRCELQSRFPKARLMNGGRQFTREVSKVVQMVEEPKGGLGLPLDVRGTAFQQRVWKALREIPPGRTASYSDIARRVGSPKASRAVASACAANAIAVAIPCHRVLHSDGSISGYRWGVQRKKALLSREK